MADAAGLLDVLKDNLLFAPIQSSVVRMALTFTESTVHDSGHVDDVDYPAVVCPSCESKLDLKP